MCSTGSSIYAGMAPSYILNTAKMQSMIIVCNFMDQIKLSYQLEYSSEISGYTCRYKNYDLSMSNSAAWFQLIFLITITIFSCFLVLWWLGVKITRHYDQPYFPLFLSYVGALSSWSYCMIYLIVTSQFSKILTVGHTSKWFWP